MLLILSHCSPQKLQQLTRVPISPTTLPAQKTSEPFHLDDLIIEKVASSWLQHALIKSLGCPGTCKAHHHPPAQVRLARLPPALLSGVYPRLLLLNLTSHPPLRVPGHRAHSSFWCHTTGRQLWIIQFYLFHTSSQIIDCSHDSVT